jgi:flavin reductase (DIM6/NTAB) family NADH-FMN oxidoreductase RutF
MEIFKEVSLKDLNLNPFTAIGDDWMLITCGNADKFNTMTASWGGLGIMWNKNAAFIVLRPQRYTKEFVDREDKFSLSFLPAAFKKELGYLGKVSGRDEDKIKNCGLKYGFADGVPYFTDSETVLICKKLFAQAYEESAFKDKNILKQMYPKNDLHTLYIAEIVHAYVKK